MSIPYRETETVAVSIVAPVTRQISLLHHAPAMLLLLMVVADSAQFPDPDLWGHLRFGQAALASGHVIVCDTYSYSVAGGPWRNHEWLSEIVMAIAYNGLGVIGIKLWKFACVAATITLMALGLAETGASPAIQLNTLGLAALAMVPQNQFRPQLFTFVLIAATLALLARDNYRGRAPLWLAVPIMMLWGNLHGGFIIGIAALAIYTGAIGLQDLMAGRGFARVLRLALITVAATLATLISPYGIDAWLVVLNALKHYAAQPIIADWDPLLYVIREQWQLKHVSAIFLVCGIVIIAAFAITFINTPHGGDLPLAIIAAIMGVAAFTAVRNMPLAVIACAAPLARHSELIAARRRKRKLASGPADAPPMAAASHDQPGVNQWLVAAIAIALAVLAGLFSRHLPVDATEYPIGAVAFIRQHDLRGNILADFAQGEYLIWHLAPASKVFIDGRYDTVYPQKVIDQYLDFMAGRSDALIVLQDYPNDFVLVPRNGRALAVMRNAAHWKLIYRDRDSALFARADSAAAKQFDTPVNGDPPRASSFP